MARLCWRQPTLAAALSVIIFAAGGAFDALAVAANGANGKAQQTDSPRINGRGHPSAGTLECSANDLVIRGGRESDGIFYAVAGYVQFTNDGRRACRLSGSPRVSVLSRDGSALTLRYRISRRAVLTPRVLPAGLHWSAELEAVWENWCGADPGPLEVRVRLPGGGSVTHGFNGPPGAALVPGCLDATKPSSLVLTNAFSHA